MVLPGKEIYPGTMTRFPQTVWLIGSVQEEPDHAIAGKEAAEKEGLKRVKIGNLHLLREESY